MVHVKLVRLGLSPRGRGSQTGHIPQSVTAGPIPAWAGQPPVVPAAAASSRAYPRVGGAAVGAAAAGALKGGLSPRGRGSRRRRRRRRYYARPIPAWAGQPGWSTGTSGPHRAYPRVGGAADNDGNPVSGRGGLSPRGRGSRPLRVMPGGRPGPIPAWAGQPWARPRRHAWRRAYPRVGGAAQALRDGRFRDQGLSPRGRGSRLQQVGDVLGFRPIPAWAGQPGTWSCTAGTTRAYPRVGGAARDYGYRMSGACAAVGLSPRGRGSPMRWHR